VSRFNRVAFFSTRSDPVTSSLSVGSLTIPSAIHLIVHMFPNKEQQAFVSRRGIEIQAEAQPLSLFSFARVSTSLLFLAL